MESIEKAVDFVVFDLFSWCPDCVKGTVIAILVAGIFMVLSRRVETCLEKRKKVRSPSHKWGR